jgi:ferric-dicitrate binding protein FerR (iron transport regulator)
MQEDTYTVALWIAKYLAKNIDEDTLQALETWKKRTPENERLYDRLIQPENFGQLTLLAQNYDRKSAWKKIKSRIHPKYSFRPNLWYSCVAAAVLLPLLLVLFVNQDNKILPETHQTSIVHGSHKATLVLDDGSQVALDDEQTFIVGETAGVKIHKNATTLNYETTAASEKIVYNQINVPRGGEYTVILSDGSSVYLNAMSSLRYPVQFSADARTVELTGEAYFEVEKSDDAFVVLTQDSKIEVLGTAFNVSSYPDDNLVQTTLVEGSLKVSMTGHKDEIILNPSEQITFDTKKKDFSIRKVDVNSFIAWKNGLFYFKDWQLKDLMNYLSRWYDFKVEYQNSEIQTRRFGGKFDRYGDLAPILNLLEQTGKVKIEIKGNTVIIK